MRFLSIQNSLLFRSICIDEIYDIVDHFFILEATRIHCLGMRKHLSWSELSSQPRFSRFREKVVHFVVDDADLAEVKWSKDTAFKLEEIQELTRWRKIRKWNEVTKALKGRDIIGVESGHYFISLLDHSLWQS